MKQIRNWKELDKIPKESDTHILEVGECNAWLRAKDKKPYDAKKNYFSQISNLHVYLSTHTFYEENYKNSTKILQACGFDVELVCYEFQK